MNKLYPKMYLKSVRELPLHILKAKNINTLLFDIDNTLAPFYEPEPNDEMIQFISNLKAQGFKVGLLSNAREARVIRFNQRINVFAFHKAGKPLTKTLKSALVKMESKPSNAAIIGDQIFTDVWCGNRAKLFSILVKPMTTRDEWITKIKRGAESLVIKSYLKSRRRKSI